MCMGRRKKGFHLRHPEDTNRTIFDNFIAILRLAKKFVISNVVSKITKFFCENRYKIVKNRPILILLMVLNLSEIAVFKTPKFLKSCHFFPSKNPREI